MIDAEMILPNYKKVKKHFKSHPFTPLFSVLYINFSITQTRKQFYTLSHQNHITQFLKIMLCDFIKYVTQSHLKIN
jgi:hypothetical protein